MRTSLELVSRAAPCSTYFSGIDVTDLLVEDLHVPIEITIATLVMIAVSSLRLARLSHDAGDAGFWVLRQQNCSLTYSGRTVVPSTGGVP